MIYLLWTVSWLHVLALVFWSGEFDFASSVSGFEVLVESHVIFQFGLSSSKVSS